MRPFLKRLAQASLGRWAASRLALAPALAAALVACASQTPLPATSTDQVRVVASFYPLYEFARQVGGERVQVSTLVPAGVEPHEWEPSPQAVASLSRAHLFVYNGAGMEPWADRLLKATEGTGAAVLVATEGMDLARASEGEEQGSLDPHVWLDPLLAQQQVQAITKALQRLDPDHAQTYGMNTDWYLGQLDQLHQEYLEGLRDCASRVVVTTHASFNYLASRYGLKAIAIAGLSPEAEPSPGRLAQLAGELKAQGTKAVYFETLVSPAVAETLAREVGVRALPLNPIEGLAPEESEAQDYLSVMRKNLASLREGLQCR